MASVGSTNNLYIGNRAARDRTFNGLIDSPYIFNRVLNASEIAWVMNETKTTSGNLTTWHDAGSGNETYQLDVNFSTSPANSNYTVYYRRNNTGDYVQVGTANHNANQSITLSTKYQNTDIRVRLEGNSTATPELTSIKFYTQTSMTVEPSITNVQNGSVGDTWGIVSFRVNQSDALTHIEYSINPDLSDALSTLNQSSGTDRSVTITGLNNGTTFYYSVYAWNSLNTSLWTNSSIFNFTTNNYSMTGLPALNTNTTPSIANIQNGSVGDTWGIVNFTINQSDASTHIEYSINPDFSGVTSTLNQSSGADRSVNITGLGSGTIYYYSVYAWNSSNTSLWTNSSIYNFTTNSNVIPPINGLLNKYTIGSGGNLWNGNSSLGNTRIRQCNNNVVLQDDVTDYISRWEFCENSGTTVHDENSTSNNDGTISGAAWSNSGKYGTALNFDGIDDYVNAGNCGSLNLRSTYTFAAWIKINNYGEGNLGRIFDRRHSTNGYVFYVANTGSVLNGIAITHDNGIASGKSSSLSTGVYKHAAVTYNGASLVFYVDGSQVGTPNSYMASVGSTNNFYIGNRAARDRTFNGLIDSPYVFDRVLNASEIAWVMNETKTTSGNLTTWHDAGSGNETYQLDVNFSTIPANSNYTVYYRRNNTGDYVQVGTANHNANQSITLSTKYQNTDIRVRLEGNSTATPELTSITFYTQTSMPVEPSITNVQNVSV